MAFLIRNQYSEAELCRLLKTKHIWLFGAGHMCGEFLKTFCFIDRVEFIFDDYAEHKEFHFKRGDWKIVDFKVYLTDSSEGRELLSSMPTDEVLFIVTSSQFVPMYKKLLRLGFKHIVFAWDLKNFTDAAVFKHAIFSDVLSSAHDHELDKVKRLLSDEISVKVWDVVTGLRKDPLLDHEQYGGGVFERHKSGRSVFREGYRSFYRRGDYC